MIKKKWLWLVIGLVAILFVVLLINELADILGANKQYADIDTYLGIGEGEKIFVCDLEISEQKAIVRSEGGTYVPLETVNSVLSSRFYYDSSIDKLLIEGNDHRVCGDVNGCIINGGGADIDAGRPALVNRDGVLLIDTELIALEGFEVIPMEKAVWIRSNLGGEYASVKAKKDTKLRETGSRRALIVRDIVEGEEMIVLENEGNYSRCIGHDGITGYIKNTDISEPESKIGQFDTSLLEYERIAEITPIRMGWHMMDMYNYPDQNARVTDVLANASGLTVISPTWYSVKSSDGSFTDFADSTYTSIAHGLGVKVWGLVDNFSQDLNNLKLLKNYDARQRLIQGIVASAVANGLDGINMDFEITGSGENAFNADCGSHYVQFLRELTKAAHSVGVSVSVDIPVPYSYNSFFDRKELGLVVDYVMVMGYDEHYNGSKEAGSVASYDFVKNGVSKTVAEVSADKVVLGVPFYTRYWIVDQAGALLGNREKSEKEMEEIIAEKGAELIWKEKEQQNYAEYQDEKGIVKVWLEDAVALRWKMDIVRNEGLAGAAAWRIGIQNEEMWKVFTE